MEKKEEKMRIQCYGSPLEIEIFRNEGK